MTLPENSVWVIKSVGKVHKKGLKGDNHLDSYPSTSSHSLL